MSHTTRSESATRATRRRGRRASALLMTMALLTCLPVVATVNVGNAATPATIVSLTFDDGNANQYAAAQVLQANGMVGTFFITTDWIGDPGWLTRANLTSMAAAGHEIGGHSVTHPDLPTISSSKASAEICNSRTTLQSWGFTVNSFAWPFASRNSAVQTLARNCGYTTARGLGDVRSPASCGSCPYAETLPPGNYFDTAAPDQVDSSWTLKNLQDLVTGAETHGGGWVQLTFHHIAVGTDPSLTISPTLFEQFVKWLAPRSANGTVVRTVQQAVTGTSPTPPTNQPPTASFTATSSNLTATFAGSGSDPDGTIAGYSWNFGDGSTGSGQNAAHSYATAGTYQVTLTVTDNRGATGALTRAVSVTAPSTPPTPPADAVVNGGFESGLGSWTTSGVTTPLQANRGHSGSKSARLGVTSGREPTGDSSLSQTVTVPTTGNPTLSLWYQPHSDDRSCSGSNCRRDWMEGQLRNAGGATLATLFKLNSDRGTWTRVTANLSAYRGQQITLWFNVHLNGPNPSDNTWMFLDDVTITS